ncbi:MAG: hypothetical protein ACUVWW_07790 [Anaerolineae bacterium]
MRRNFLWVAAACLVLLSVASPAWAGEGRIGGRVELGASGKPVEGATVVLHAFREMKEEEVGRTVTGADGAFQFSVAYDAGKVFWVSTEYQGIRYTSDLLRLTDEQPEATAVLQVYEATANPEHIRIARGHFIVEFAEGAVHVAELYVVGNEGLATYVGDEQGRTLQFLLPPGATDVTVDDAPPSSRFVREGDVLWDTAPVLPGESVAQHLVDYVLPYDPDQGLEIVRSYAYPVAQVNLMVPQVGVDVESDLEFTGTVGAERTYLVWRGASLAPGQTWTARFRGRPQVGTAGEPAATLVPERRPLVAFGGLAFLVLAAFLVLGLRTGGKAREDPERLLEAIARLDEAYEDGELDEATYRERRAALKEALVRQVAQGRRGSVRSAGPHD